MSQARVVRAAIVSRTPATGKLKPGPREVPRPTGSPPHSHSWLSPDICLSSNAWRGKRLEGHCPTFPAIPEDWRVRERLGWGVSPPPASAIHENTLRPRGSGLNFLRRPLLRLSLWALWALWAWDVAWRFEDQLGRGELRGWKGSSPLGFPV